MAAVPESPRRCVVWFGRPLRREREALAAAGWQVRVSDPDGNAGIGLRGGDTVVGLVDLRVAAADGYAPLERLFIHCTDLSLLAIVPAGRAMPARIGALLERCIEAFQAPPDLARMIGVLDTLAPPSAMAEQTGIDRLLGRSTVMRTTQANIRKFAPVDLPVLITGETGTGKEVAARAVHELSARRTQPFLAINCGALSPGLVQSELFGHERGAFTGATARRAGLFEAADGGTLFLDEIGDLPQDAQTNLLRVLQERCVERVGSRQRIEVDVRVLAATNADLEAEVEHGRFRSDLYYRLNVLRLHMPRLADRGEDIELLARHFLAAFRRRHETHARGFATDARRAMRGFDWPGHVRELLNRVQRAAVTAESELISARDLGLAELVPATAPGELELARAAAERDAVLACLRQCGFNISEAARRLKVSRVTVYRLCHKHRLVLDELR